ncbi:unnamed protein product [Kluyveromyces dobzhanskii CBS 2104]|uniref:Ras modification protein ERF4 n=1 Tax=Kluyveromyces dobzhanskii CBS 2104 TaxID=1427455 RepID=A0A0A8L0Y6_9SACH|nr:unnamed protein product [Kluyveromyces dobzhanskii CBS 2104]
MTILELAETADSSDLSKAGITVEESGPTQQPKFFNYHEFVITRYRALDQDTCVEHGPEQPICITHFPNIYVSAESEEFQRTRIVRIPRRFEATADFPCFSTQLPGSEPAALPDSNGKQFVPVGEFEGQLFGETSVSPLSNHVGEEKWTEIITKINALLAAAYNPITMRNFFSIMLDFFTLNLWSIVEPYLLSNPLQLVEDYISEQNRCELFRSQRIKIISPRESSYLSVCTTFKNS